MTPVIDYQLSNDALVRMAPEPRLWARELGDAELVAWTRQLKQFGHPLMTSSEMAAVDLLWEALHDELRVRTHLRRLGVKTRDNLFDLGARGERSAVEAVMDLPESRMDRSSPEAFTACVETLAQDRTATSDERRRARAVRRERPGRPRSLSRGESNAIWHGIRAGLSQRAMARALANDISPEADTLEAIDRWIRVVPSQSRPRGRPRKYEVAVSGPASPDGFDAVRDAVKHEVAGARFYDQVVEAGNLIRQRWPVFVEGGEL